MIVRAPSKDADGVIRRLDLIFYKVQFGPFTFSGPAYKAGMEVSYSARALSSASNEIGTAFPDGKKRVGRLVSGPQI